VLVLTSTITCPSCGFEKQEPMPGNACVHFYECTHPPTLEQGSRFDPTPTRRVPQSWQCDAKKWLFESKTLLIQSSRYGALLTDNLHGSGDPTEHRRPDRLLSTSSSFFSPSSTAIALVSRPAMRHSSITLVK
jgi:hypothetical protein